MHSQFATCRNTFIVLALSLITLASGTEAAGIYKSIDSEGNVIFTDQPSEAAEAIDGEAKKQRSISSQSESVRPLDEGVEPEDEEKYGPILPAATVLVAPDPINPPKPDPVDIEEPSAVLPVTRVEVLTPEHNTTFIDPLGQIWVEVQSYPTPMSKSGLTAQLWVDETLITSDNSTVLRLPPPTRGTHVLQVKLVDRQGRLHKSSNTINIHVKYRSAEH